MTEQSLASTPFVAGGSATNGGPASYFRRDIEVGESLRRAILKVTALGIAVPRLNGVRIGDEVLAPGWTSYRHRLLVRSHDVTDVVRPGANTLAAVVGEGWAAGPLTWDLRPHLWTDRPVLWARLELDYGDRVEVIDTSDGFRVGEGGVRSNGIYHGETFDARLEPKGWDAPGFDDTDWSPAQPFAWNHSALVEEPVPPIKRIEEIEPVAVATSPAGSVIVDFGQVLTGWVRLTVQGDAGTEITLRGCKLLTPEGEPQFETLRTAEATDRYVLSGGEPETWEPESTFHGFRYVQVSGWPG